MNIFGDILSKLGIGNDKKEADASTPTVAPAPEAAPVAATPESVPSVIAISEIDVVAQLEALAQSHAEKLNWKVSIVDLLKLLGIDSSLTALKELATELGYPVGLSHENFRPS